MKGKKKMRTTRGKRRTSVTAIARRTATRGRRQTWKQGLISDFEKAGVSTSAIRPITRAIGRRVANDPQALVKLLQIGWRG